MTWTHRLDCRLMYDFNTRIGELYLQPGQYADMQDCVDLFQAIDPVVREIQTWSGSDRDTNYLYDHNRWIAGTPLHPNLRRHLQQEMG